MLQALKALLQCSLVWCLAASSVVAGRQKTALSRATVLAANSGVRVGGYPSNPSGKSGHSVFWFLAQWVKFLQGIGSRHSALGAKSKIKGKQALNKSQQYAADGRRTPFPWLLRRHSKVAAVLRR